MFLSIRLPLICIGRLPGLTNRLASEVLEADCDTIIVHQSGTPTEMPWVDGAKTLLQVNAP